MENLVVNEDNRLEWMKIIAANCIILTDAYYKYWHLIQSASILNILNHQHNNNITQYKERHDWLWPHPSIGSK